MQGRRHDSICDVLIGMWKALGGTCAADHKKELNRLGSNLIGSECALPSGNRVVATSRPEGVRRDLYAWRFVVVDLEPLTNDQLCDAIEMLDADPERVFDKLIDAQVRENVPSPPRTFPL